jgi:hypothetical protein
MCQLTNCKYAEIIDGLPSDKKMYIHCDDKFIPFWIDYYDKCFIAEKKKTLKRRKVFKSSHVLKLNRKTCKVKIFDPSKEYYY